ncbi:hypothetical protein SprV_0702356100 [Sparganum proliferum]
MDADVLFVYAEKEDAVQLTCVNRYARWPEAISLPDVEALTVAKAFLGLRVVIFEAFSNITTDRRVQFEFSLFLSPLFFLGCAGNHTTAYHPAAYGMIGRFNRQLRIFLRVADDPNNWTDHHPSVLLGIHSALKPDLDSSPAGLVLAAIVRLPGSVISQTPRGAVEDRTNLLHRLRLFM